MKETRFFIPQQLIPATLEGRKTQARVTIEPQPYYPEPEKTDNGLYIDAYNKTNEWVWWGKDNRIYGKDSYYCPFGVVGDRLWVPEVWCPVDDTEFGEDKWVDYRATPRYAEPGVSHPAGWENAPNDLEALHWRSPVVMPRWASRILREITNVRVERLQDISEADAVAEGIEILDTTLGGENIYPDYSNKPGEWWRRYCQTKDPIKSFASLWDSIYAKRGHPWVKNDWVWVVEFKVLEK